uniref:Bromo domain-containing protein n=1 Tax=Caenorhabditis japonica TaxID=281687 RepID=A0A8R1I8D5_CAEJA
MPADEPRKSMVGAPPSTRRGRGGATPATTTPVIPRTSARAAKRVKKEEPEDDYKEDVSDLEKSEEEESEDSGDDVATPSKKGGGGTGTRRKKRVPLTDYHLKKKKILARKAQREAEKEREKELAVEEPEPVKEPTPPPVRKPPSFSSFTAIQLIQDHILRKLVEKDPEQYFAFPVTPSMAPDYGEIVKEPMDLQTIREKIEDQKYPSLPMMKEDCQLIVANAMLYNQPNTVFYLAANRLSNLIKYYFGEQYLRFLFHTLPFANQIPFELVGIRPLAPVISERFNNKRKGLVKDSMTSEDCFKNADAKVRDRLSVKLPENKNQKGKLGFLSERNGTVVLNVVAGNNDSNVAENNVPRKVTLGDIVGPLEEGTPGMIQMAEHRLYSQAPLNYLNYGPYSSFAPMYDSTWSTMSKEDTDLFLRTYGDRANATDVVSLRRFVSGCDEFSEMVNGLLDTLTDGEHSRAMKELETNEKDEPMTDIDLPKNESLLSLLDDVTSVSNLGIETGFLNDIRQQVLVPKVSENMAEPTQEYMVGMEHMSVQQQLDHVGQEIKDLAHLQETRLCQPPPTMLMSVQEPGSVEQKLAENIQQHLAHQITQHTAPEAFVNDAVIHNAMGVDMEEDDLFNEFFVTN